MTIGGPYPVESNTAIASEEFMFKKGGRTALNKFYFDAWTASGVCRAINSIEGSGAPCSLAAIGAPTPAHENGASHRCQPQ
jgi:hypothetical protein